MIKFLPNNQIITFSRKGYIEKGNNKNSHNFEDIPLSKEIMVLGYSWGNVPALNFTAKNASHIKGIIIVSPYIYPTNRTNIFKKILVSHPLSIIIFMLFGRRIISNMLRKSSYPSSVPASYQKLSRELSNPHLLEIAVIEKRKNFLRDEVLKKISEAKIPVAIIWGDKDLTSKENKQIFPIRRIIHPILEKHLSNVGHAIPFTNTKDLAEFIEAFVSIVNKGRKL